MSYDSCVRIERMANGYSVCVKDPAIVKANAKPGPYKNADREYVFKTVEEVLKFLNKTLDKALPEDDGGSFDATFDKAASAVTKD